MVVIDCSEDVASTSVVATIALGGEGMNMNGHCNPLPSNLQLAPFQRG